MNDCGGEDRREGRLQESLHQSPHGPSINILHGQPWSKSLKSSAAGSGRRSHGGPDDPLPLPARLGGALIFGGHDEEDNRARLFAGVDGLLDSIDMPRTLRECGVDEQEFLNELPELAMTAFEDLSNRTNPRMPMVAEITELLRAGYYGSGS